MAPAAPSASGAGATLLQQIQTREQLSEKLCTVGLKVVELYSGWCGPCVAVHPLVKKLKMELDERPIEFLSAKTDDIEDLKNFQMKSQPHFLLYRNGILKETVVGVNLPALSELIPQLCPVLSSEDDPEDNPFFIKRREEQAQALARLKQQQ